MRKTELAPLTGIRAYAAFFVYLSHLPDVIPGMGDLGGPYLIFNAGVVSVSFFFVLSGFILTYNYGSLFREGISGRDYARFVWDRLTKIYPVHLLTMLLIMPISAVSPHHPMNWRALPFHLTLLQCWWPFPSQRLQDYLNVPSWSISCEFFFYVLAPLAMFLVMRRARRFLLFLFICCYALGLCLVLWRGHSDYDRLFLVSWFAPSRMPEFLTGVFLGRLFLMRNVVKNTALAGLAQAAGVILIVSGASFRAHAPWPLWGGLLYVPGSALLVLGLAYGGGPFAAHLSGSWMRRLGLASFSLYLVHAPILRIVKNIFNLVHWRVQSWPVYWATTIVLFVLVQVAAFLIYYSYEIPVQKRLRRLLDAPGKLTRPAYAG